MASCFPHPRHHPKLLSFFKPRFHVSFSHRGRGAANSSDLSNRHKLPCLRKSDPQVCHWEMMKARNPTAPWKELRRVIPVCPKPGTADTDGEYMEKIEEEHEGDDESEEDFFSARSRFSVCSTGGGGEEVWWEERCGLWGRTAVGLSEEWFRECDGWPFGLWRRRRRKVVLPPPPPPKSPSDSWSWHKSNLRNGKVWPVCAATVNNIV
ncbi:hypothetical protein KSP40_PGU004795 [Platanthera guangdongensis]|uniref:Uncharacterized protein n=1 Tax=Platanthera guangdongensis TaxID=2320717 RepID=A0ABR2MYK7_9ASPA